MISEFMFFKFSSLGTHATKSEENNVTFWEHKHIIGPSRKSQDNHLSLLSEFQFKFNPGRVNYENVQSVDWNFKCKYKIDFVVYFFFYCIAIDKNKQIHFLQIPESCILSRRCIPPNMRHIPEITTAIIQKH